MSIALGWYVPTRRGYSGRQKPRWALAIGDNWALAIGDNWVIYATGGERHRECRHSTFEKWQRRVAAEFNPARVASVRLMTEAQLEIAE